MKFHPAVLDAKQTRVLRDIGPVLAKANFYLAGGTAVALQLGHRRSVDLDWFTPDTITDPHVLAEQLRTQAIPFKTTKVFPGALHGSVGGVRVSLLEFPYRMLRPLVSCKALRCRIASLPDLAAMKMAAVSQRGSKKDFVDVYALGKTTMPLSEMAGCYRRKFSVSDLAHLLYSLSYFKDADSQPMPTMLARVNWRSMKQTIREWVLGIDEA